MILFSSPGGTDKKGNPVPPVNMVQGVYVVPLCKACNANHGNTWGHDMTGVPGFRFGRLAPGSKCLREKKTIEQQIFDATSPQLQRLRVPAAPGLVLTQVRVRYNYSSTAVQLLRTYNPVANITLQKIITRMFQPWLLSV